MGKRTIDNLKNIDVQHRIKEAIDKRRDEIRGLFGYDPKTESSVIITVIPIFASVAFFMYYFLIGLYDTSNPIIAVLKWTVMIAIYMSLVFYIHSLSFPSVNLVNVIYSLIPIVFIKILLWRWPAVSTPIDNTLGVIYNKYFGPLSGLLENIKYEPLQYAPFDKISDTLFNKIPLDWLFNSVNEDDDVIKWLQEEKYGERKLDEVIKNIYIQTTVDSEGYEVYGREDIIYDLNELSQWKRYIGHMTYDYIAFVVGLTYSMVL